MAEHLPAMSADAIRDDEQAERRQRPSMEAEPMRRWTSTRRRGVKVLGKGG